MFEDIGSAVCLIPSNAAVWVVKAISNVRGCRETGVLASLDASPVRQRSSLAARFVRGADETCCWGDWYQMPCAFGEVPQGEVHVSGTFVGVVLVCSAEDMGNGG